MSKAAGILSKLRPYVDTQILITVYNALVHSKLSYGILSWGSASNSLLQPINVLQNRILRTVSKSGRYKNCTDMYLNMRILKLQDVYDLELTKFMHSFHHKSLPTCLISLFTLVQNAHSTSTRNFANNALYIPIVRKSSFLYSLEYRGSVHWNSIPNDLKSLTKSQIKKQYKILLLSKY